MVSQEFFEKMLERYDVNEYVEKRAWLAYSMYILWIILYAFVAVIGTTFFYCIIKSINIPISFISNIAMFLLIFQILATILCCYCIHFKNKMIDIYKASFDKEIEDTRTWD